MCCKGAPSEKGTVLQALELHALLKGCKFEASVSARLNRSFSQRGLIEVEGLNLRKQQAEESLLALTVPKALARMFPDETGSLEALQVWLATPRVLETEVPSTRSRCISSQELKSS